MSANGQLCKSNVIALRLSSIGFGFIFLIFVNFLLWVWYLYVFACVPMLVCLWGLEIGVGCLLVSPSTLRFEAGPQLNLEPITSARHLATSSSHLLVSVSPMLGIQMHASILGLCVNDEDPNPGPHAYTAGTLLTPFISLAPIFHSHLS